MNLLAFDTSTDTMSIAVCQGAQVWQHSGAGGAQASASLIPAIMALMSQAGLRFEALDAIAFGRGPGSFTGLRTACSVAQGLALGAGVPVLPVDTLLTVAEEARFALQSRRETGGPSPLTALRVMSLLDARMDEVYAACYEFDGARWQQHGDYCLCQPEHLMQGLDLPADSKAGWQIAGNAHPVYGARLPVFVVPPVLALPTAAAMLRLAPALLASGQALPADQALPTYIRDKVAKTTLERQVEKTETAIATATTAR